MSDLSDKLWNEGFFPVVGEPWTLEDHERIRKLRQRIAELEGHYNRIKSQTCLCRFDKANGEGEPGTVPSTECEYHKALRADNERLRAAVTAAQEQGIAEGRIVGKCNKRIEELESKLEIKGDHPFPDDFTALDLCVERNKSLLATNERLRAVCEMALKDQQGWPNRMREALRGSREQ